MLCCVGCYNNVLIVPTSVSLLINFTQLTGTVSHVLGKATFDSSFQEEREQIVESAQSGGGYFMAGLMGFTGGVFSGITSMVTQPYKGAQESGIGVRDVVVTSIIPSLFMCFERSGYDAR